MSQILTLAFQALSELRILRICYRSEGQKRTVRDIDVYWVNEDYIDAVCRLRRDSRCFRIDRIEQAELLPETFDRDPELAIFLKLTGRAAPPSPRPAIPGPRHPLPGKESA